MKRSASWTHACHREMAQLETHLGGLKRLREEFDELMGLAPTISFPATPPRTPRNPMSCPAETAVDEDDDDEDEVLGAVVVVEPGDSSKPEPPYQESSDDGLLWCEEDGDALLLPIAEVLPLLSPPPSPQRGSLGMPFSGFSFHFADPYRPPFRGSLWRSGKIDGGGGGGCGRSVILPKGDAEDDLLLPSSLPVVLW